MTTKNTDETFINRSMEFLKAVGQKPVLVRSYVLDYLLNRIQTAVLREAIHLVEKGVASVDGVDSVIRDGLGLRWALLGCFAVNNTNADGGIREYYARYGESYRETMADLDCTPSSFNEDMVEKIAKEVDLMEGGVPIREICRWRDRLIGKIKALKEADPHPGNNYE
jgi:3-hydroxyacyl-CoA dehydrogenase